MANIALQEDSMPALLLPRMGMGDDGRGVCRSLFGPIDHDELRSELKRQLKEIQASDCQRWNFDFEAGTPLKGTFCWEPLESKEMPILYRESRLCPVSATPLSRQASTRLPVPTVDTREEPPAEIVQGNEECAKENADKAVKKCQGAKGPSKTSTHSTSSLLRKREISTSITDYFPKRKRLQAPKTDTLKVAHHPLCTLEQTPRKKIR
ncbi:cyclin-dependent kinase inhibitor 1-like [Bufo gargarizans]|uniref:cyclin-dependent kinase inhibitor 1-like n=1 Tax=Bufo gargarizans TaxID=30331 RepID=UPI001CF2D036|nr:cyclin-dependent kinase inhibitor 1-like [Bufo gargarizans]